MYTRTVPRPACMRCGIGLDIWCGYGHMLDMYCLRAAAWTAQGFQSPPPGSRQCSLACCCKRSGEMNNVVDATAATDSLLPTCCTWHTCIGFPAIIRGQTSPEGFDPSRTTSCFRPFLLHSLKKRPTYIFSCWVEDTTYPSPAAP